MTESTVERTSVFNSSDPQSTLLSVNMSSVLKLTNQNYLMWRRQVRALLEGHELQQFIDDSLPAPKIVTDGVEAPNPAYAPWRRQDKLLFSSMLGAISPAVQSVVSTAATTKEVWDNLAMAFGNPTRGHIRQLKFAMRSCVKGNKSISEYLRIMKSKADDLALLGKPLDTEDFTEQVLAGLPEEFKAEIDAINGRDSPIGYTELYERLLNREAMIVCAKPCAASSAVTPVVAHVADSKSRQSQQRPQQNNTYGNDRNRTQPRNNFNNNGYPQRFSKPYLGRCQACGVQGHSAK